MDLEKKALYMFETFKDKESSIKGIDVIIEELETYNKRGMKIWLIERIKDWNKVKLIIKKRY
tara:strand:+ start:642 stop:827 length:186 start_codon:yes stop_codon:yes gene_type:complete